MIARSSDVRSALRGRQRGFLLNPYRFGEAPTRTYATWNPLDKAANISLYNSNLRASTSPSTSGLVRSTVGKSSGKWYWEYTTNVTAGMIGVALGSAQLTSYPGSDGSGRGYFHNGSKYLSSGASPYGIGYTSPLGKVIGVALDMDAGTVGFYVDGAYQGVAFSSLTGVYFAGAGGVNGPTINYDMNFGASPFARPVPPGFNHGLYSE